MAAALHILADQTTAHYFRLARLSALDEWWQWLLLAGVVVLIVAYVALMYRRDGVDLPRGFTILLAVLRLAAFAGLLVFFLQVERRADREVTKSSRAVLLVDTSQSMGLPNSIEPGASSATRSQQVIDELQSGSLLSSMRAKHEVVVYRFDQADRPAEIATFPRYTGDESNVDPERAAVASYLRTAQEARLLSAIAGGLLGLALLAAMVHVIFRRPTGPQREESYSLLIATVALMIAAVVLGVANLRAPEVPWQVLIGLRAPQADDIQPPSTLTTGDEETAPLAEPTIDWVAELNPRGLETRLGDALRFIIGKERGGPIAAVIVISDGGQNAGIETQIAIAEAQDAAIPIYTVGLGSDKLPQNVKLVDIEAPQRVYPGDEFTLTAYVQGTGLAGSQAQLRLFSGPAEATESELVEDLAQQQTLRLGEDTDVAPVAFKLKPPELGRRQYQVRVATSASDHDPRDNQRTVVVEVVDRKTKVLLLAGGPAREFRFLRNQLYRDPDVTVDVLLQTSQAEASQEADEVLSSFPSTEEELFSYDCILGFDPDWETLDEVQMTLLERWVAEKAGGLIVVAGPVHTPQWAGRRRGDSRFETIKALYPVVFYTSGSATLNLSRTGGDAAWPLQFTREGFEAEFLWLTDDPITSEVAWQSFGGVYGYFAVKDPKPAAKVYARFADPNTSIDNELPIYLAGQFYGAGRVFFQASGEMWRVRAVDDAFFETYYTKLIRWASQGRLMQDSNRGVLLVDKERSLLGEQIVVRAILTDAQRQPLTDPEVSVVIVQPDSTRKTLSLPLVKDAPRPGTYAGQFTVAQLGDYRLELRIPHTSDNELLTRTVRVDAPKREIQSPQRNDALLREIAQKTDAAYYIGMASTISGSGLPPLANTIEPQDQVTVIPGTPDRAFDRLLMTWLMGLIVGFLCLEWLLRRLSKLA